MAYYLTKNSQGAWTDEVIICLDDNGRVCQIPNDESNRDRKAYSKWVKEGNQPFRKCWQTAYNQMISRK